TPLEFEVRYDARFRRRLLRESSRKARVALVVNGLLFVLSGLAGLAGNSGWVLVGAFTLFIGVLFEVTALRTLIPSNTSMPQTSFQPFRYQIGADGIEWISGNGTSVRVPWQAISRVDTRADRWFIVADQGHALRVIPRGGLTPELDDAVCKAIDAGLNRSATMAG